MSNRLCRRSPKILFYAVCCCLCAGRPAAAVDGTWIQPLDSNYSISTAQYWQHATVANGGGSVMFLNQGSNRTKTLGNNVGTLTWNNVDLGASAFTLTGMLILFR